MHVSMFRRPGDSSSSSSSDDSDEQVEDHSIGPAQRDRLLTGVNTLDSSGEPATRSSTPRLESQQNSAQNVRDLLLHSLLEKEAMREAEVKSGKGQSDPDVQKLGNEVYKELARQIFNTTDTSYASDEMQAHRATAQEGISRLTKSKLGEFSMLSRGVLQDLVVQPRSMLNIDSLQQPSPGFNIATGFVLPPKLNLRGFPSPEVNRYYQDFAELEMVGKGGYGKVFKARHNLDGSFYAVKRIPISQIKLARVQEYGSQELDSMLDEVRLLARLEHANIVRYHNAWLEFGTEKQKGISLDIVRDDRQIEGTMVTKNMKELDLQHATKTLDDNYGASIVFGTTDSETGSDECRNCTSYDVVKGPVRFLRQEDSKSSFVSLASASTTKSTGFHRLAIADAGEDEEEGVEDVPRACIPHSQSSLSEPSDSLMSHSDLPNDLVSARLQGPALTLNVQMSLCESNLATLLSADYPSSLQPGHVHCFHPCVSLQLLNHIVSGVRYLHAQNVVHHDLKPANIFLSLSQAQDAPYGSVDVSSCKSCPRKDTLHLTPRIGDFGLAAAMNEKSVEASTKPIGTEFYRPSTANNVTEELDIYALGVIGFELLHPFGTRMERIAAMKDLREGRFPDNFASSFENHEMELKGLIGSMIGHDTPPLTTCAQLKTELEKLIHILGA